MVVQARLPAWNIRRAAAQAEKRPVVNTGLLWLGI
jgi:hypothetical protein